MIVFSKLNPSIIPLTGYLRVFGGSSTYFRRHGVLVTSADLLPSAILILNYFIKYLSKFYFSVICGLMSEMHSKIAVRPKLWV